MRVRIDIAYDGTCYQGWQVQAHTNQTIQGLIQRALKHVFQKDICVHGSGRTDTGVHAEGQVAHFDLPTSHSVFANKKSFYMMRALQFYLPPDIVIKKTYLVEPNFHARLSGIQKIYVYHIFNCEYLDPFVRHCVHWVPRTLDINYLQDVAKHLVGTLDFKSFQNAGSNVKETLCVIRKAKWSKIGPYVEFRIEGDRFLKQMVRNIVGSLLWMECKKIDPCHLKNIIEAKDRRSAYETAPAKGLSLKEVIYPDKVQRQCQPFNAFPLDVYSSLP